MSMFLLGRSVSVPSACSSYDMKTRFPNSRKRSQRVQPGLQSSVPQPASSPQSQYISESGPHGPGPPTDQKFSEEGSGTIRSTGIPIRSQRAIASSSGPSFRPGSPAWTLTQTLSQSSFNRSRMNSVAYSIAPSLKYWPNEKLPSISKNVRWNVSRPTSSMSGVRKTFWHVVVSGAGGRLEPEEERHLRLHARARVERRDVVGARDQGRGRTAEMVLLLVEGLEPFPQLGRRAHGGHCRSGRSGDGRAAITSDRAVGRSDAGRTRRRRRRYRTGRVFLVVLVVLAAAGAGVWFGRHAARTADAALLRRRCAHRRLRAKSTPRVPRSRNRRAASSSEHRSSRATTSVSARPPRSSSTPARGASSGQSARTSGGRSPR